MEIERLAIANDMRNRFRWSNEFLAEVAIWGDPDHCFCARRELERRHRSAKATEVIGSSVGLALCAVSALFFSIALAPDHAMAETIDSSPKSAWALIADIAFAWIVLSFIGAGIYAFLRLRTKPVDYTVDMDEPFRAKYRGDCEQ